MKSWYTKHGITSETTEKQNGNEKNLLLWFSQIIKSETIELSKLGFGRMKGQHVEKEESKAEDRSDVESGGESGGEKEDTMGDSSSEEEERSQLSLPPSPELFH